MSAFKRSPTIEHIAQFVGKLRLLRADIASWPIVFKRAACIRYERQFDKTLASNRGGHVAQFRDFKFVKQFN